MNLNPRVRRVLVLVGVAIPLFLAADLRSVEATCGGGGGGGSGGVPGAGGGPVYETSWTPSLNDALTKAAEGKKAIVIYFEAEGSTLDHPFFRTKIMQEISKEHAVVKFIYSKDDPLRAAFEVPKDQHVLHVCDWYANSLKGFAAGPKQKFPYRAIEDILKSLGRAVDQIVKKFEGSLKSAEKQFEKGEAADALKTMGDLVNFKGHPVAVQAKPLIAKIEAVATKEIDEALKIEDKKARAKELQKIKTRYKNLKGIEARCAKEIESATGQVPGRDPETARGTSAVAEVMDALFGSVDYSRRAPSITERADQAMIDGLGCERREEYEKAMEFYAMAAGLDPKDSIALIYLGEVYRHHLGRWSDARKTFQRVVELDNSDLAMAVALHGLGKMTIWDGNNEEGLKFLEASLKRRPTAMCYRNLAVFWNTENEFRKAFGFASQAFALNPDDPYNQVFYAVYLIMDGQKEKGEAIIQKAQFNPSMSYNYACYYAAVGNHELVFKYLHRHFYGYEKYDDVRRFEMAEARMDINFKRYKDDPKFMELTALAGK